MSGYQDSNLGPPAPKAGALPGCATSRKNYLFVLLQDLFGPGTLPPLAQERGGMRYRAALHPEKIIFSFFFKNSWVLGPSRRSLKSVAGCATGLRYIPNLIC